MRRIYALFAISGAAGLVYQVVWSSLLKQTLGVTVYAVTTVLATFLGGLALGSFVFGKMADRVSRPLRLYGWLEIGIAIAAVAGAALHVTLAPLHLRAANYLADSPTSLMLVRFLFGALVILPTTTLMGGTLPVMTRAAVQKLQVVGRELSLLYALNTLGAVVGCLGTGFLLIRLFGIHGSLFLAAAVNLLVGLLSLWLSRGMADIRVVPLENNSAPSGSRGIGLLVVIGLSGFVALGLEVLWTRVLVQIIGTTVYAFSTMLASFLIGITIGSFIAQRIADTVGNARRFFGWLQLGIAASTLATLPLINSGVAQRWVGGHGTDRVDLFLMRFLVSLLVMLVPATLIGMTVPLAVKLWTREFERLGSSVGQVFTANMLGNIVGTLVTGFLLLPFLGLQKSIVALTVLNLLSAAWGLSASEGRGRFVFSRQSAVLVVALVAWALLLFSWQPQPFRLWGEEVGDRVLYYREGVVNTVRVIQKHDQPDQLWMGVDAIMIGQSFGGVDAKQQSLAHYPFLLRREAPRRLLTIGMGTGILAGEIARHPQVEQVDCLEISPSVIEAAGVFHRFNGDVLNNDKVRVINDDGVNFLRRTDARYDTIVSDGKSRTTHAANGLFFSLDYYRLSHRRLAEDGLMIQWIPLSLPPQEMQIILRTFLSVFPHGYVFVSPPHAAFVVGSNKPLELDMRHIQSVLESPSVSSLNRYGLTQAAQFVRSLTADSESLAAMLDGSTVINSLEHPVLEFYSPSQHAVDPAVRTDKNLIGLQAREGHPRQRVLPADRRGLFEAERSASAKLGQALEALESEDPRGFEPALTLVREASQAVAPRSIGGYTAAAAYRLALEIDPALPEVRFELARLLRDQGRIAGAVREYNAGLETDSANPVARTELGLMLLSVDRYEAAANHLTTALRAQPELPGALAGMARVLTRHVDPRKRDPRRAVQMAAEASRLTEHRNAWILDVLADAYAAVGRPDLAAEAGGRALQVLRPSGDERLGSEIRRKLAGYPQAPG